MTPNEGSNNDQKSREVISLTNTESLSLAGLPEDQQIAIRRMDAENQIRLRAKAQELGIEAMATHQRLATMSDAAAKAESDGNSVTITSTINDSMGRTETIIGNTETAQKGKLSRSQAGLKDYTMVYIIAAVVVILIVVIMSK
jgi:hypothetical protein